MAKKARSLYSGGAHPRLDQDQVPAPPGVRDRRLHGPPGLARPLRRAASRGLRRPRRSPAPRLRVEGGHRLRRRQAQGDPGSSSTRSPAPRRRSTPARSRPAAATTGSSRGSSCEVRFTDWTDDGGLRHPTFIGLRDDKKPPSAVAKSRSHRMEPEPIEPDDRSTAPRREEMRRNGASRSRSTIDASRPAEPSGGGGLGAERHPLPPIRTRSPGGTSTGALSAHQPQENLLARTSPHQRRSDRVLRARRAADAAVSARPASGPHPLSRRDHRQVVLPEGRARLRAGLGAHRAHLLAGHRARHRATWSWTTSRCCATWPTVAPIPIHVWASRDPPRSSGRTGWSSTSIPRARRSPTWSGSRSPCAASWTSSSCRAT